MANLSLVSNESLAKAVEDGVASYDIGEQVTEALGYGGIMYHQVEFAIGRNNADGDHNLAFALLPTGEDVLIGSIAADHYLWKCTIGIEYFGRSRFLTRAIIAALLRREAHE